MPIVGNINNNNFVFYLESGVDGLLGVFAFTASLGVLVKSSVEAVWERSRDHIVLKTVPQCDSSYAKTELTTAKPTSINQQFVYVTAKIVIAVIEPEKQITVKILFVCYDSRSLLFSSVVSPKHFIMSSCDNLLSHFINLVTLLWTFSNIDLSFWSYGDQACTQYSRCRLTWFIQDSKATSIHILNCLLIMPRTEFVFLAVSAHCFSGNKVTWASIFELL